METGRFILVPPKYDESMGEGEEKALYTIQTQEGGPQNGAEAKNYLA